MEDNMNADYSRYLDNYFMETCREERQYALFLYNVFAGVKNKKSELWDEDSKDMIAKCLYPNAAERTEKLEETKIIEVIYEVTLMRDFFERNRTEAKKLCIKRREKTWKSVVSQYKLSDLAREDAEVYQNYCFNQHLVDFCCQSFSKSEEAKRELYQKIPVYKNLHDKRNFPYEELGDDGKSILDMAQKMMNAKPDLGVIYSDNEGKKIVFLECKYLSSEGNGQIGIQKNILNFLCGENGILSEEYSYNGEGVHLVKFQSCNEEEKENVWQEKFKSNSQNIEIPQINICKDFLVELSGRAADGRVDYS